MRLAIFWSEIFHYHAARIRALYHLADQARDTVDAFALRPKTPGLGMGGYQALLNGRIEVLSWRSEVGGMNSFYSGRQLVKRLSETNPDTVAIMGYDLLVPRVVLGWCRLKRRGAVLMSESQATDYPRKAWKEWVKRRFVALYDAAFVGGSSQFAYMKQLGMPSDRILTGYDVVDNRYWSEKAEKARRDPHMWQKRYDLPAHFFVTACRLIPKKNISGLLRAYARYVNQASQRPWPLVIIGDGPLRQESHTLVSDLDLNNLVHFLGYLSAEEMASVFGLASMFVLASAYSEQWGLVVNEAMAAGLPVLVSSICGSAADLVIKGLTGFTFDARDEFQLAGLLHLASSGEVDLDALRRGAQAHISKFSPEVFAQNLITAAKVATAHAQSRLSWQR
jgi:1,2-diacylglycerol 3-alpha-glucosyltransferase